MRLCYDPLPDLVFQCAGCKTILSDSRELVCTADSADAKLLALRGATEVTVDRIAQTAAQATYFAVCCTGCGGVVGRLYTVLPPELAALQHLFCLEATKCHSYELGSCDMRVAAAGAAAEQQQRQARPGSPLPQQAQLGSPAGADMLLGCLQRIEMLEAELTKLQGMLLLHDVQLKTLPAYQAGQPAADEAGTAAAAQQQQQQQQQQYGMPGQLFR